MNHIEIELRYEVLQLEKLTAFLAGFKKLHQKHDVDLYVDTPEAFLYQRGIFIRLRNDKKLDIKFNRACLDDPELPPQDYCEEHSFALPLQPQDLGKLNLLLESLDLKSLSHASMDQLMQIHNFKTHYIIDKIRTSYAIDNFTIAVDEVAGLGTFLEIELMAENVDNLVLVKHQMQTMLKGLDLEPLKAGYGTMLLRKSNFEQYLLGRFVLEEDKIHRKSPAHGDPRIEGLF